MFVSNFYSNITQDKTIREIQKSEKAVRLFYCSGVAKKDVLNHGFS